ncbi:MAG TPA: hypothetical protein VEO74_15230 [Thermoanaerobaculia bacterium]|nr:hypothetical protein [Thermoanaerobaculia bacterium]
MIYRKWGRAVRWENGTIVRVEEAGEAREEDGVFFAQPIAHGVIPSGREGSPARVIAVAEGILRCAQDDMKIERVLVSEGIALHECDSVRWHEETRHVHVALTRGPWRVLIDDAEVVGRVADALARCEGERDFEHVLVPPQIKIDVNCEKEQMPGGLDGYGRPIERHRVEGEPPNFYRPSYRVRPVRRWMNVRAIPFGTMRPAPQVIALVDGAKALVEHDERVFVTRLRVDRVTAAGERGEMLL